MKAAKVGPFSDYWKAAYGSSLPVLAARLLLSSILLYKVWQETGKWTVLFAVLTLIYVETRPLVKALDYRKIDRLLQVWSAPR